MNRRKISKAYKRFNKHQRSALLHSTRIWGATLDTMSSPEVQEVPLTPRHQPTSFSLTPPQQPSKQAEECIIISDEEPNSPTPTSSKKPPRQPNTAYVSPDVEEVPLTAPTPRPPLPQSQPQSAPSNVEEVAWTRFVAGKPPPRNFVQSIPLAPQRISGVDLKAAQQITRRILQEKHVVPTYYYMPDLDLTYSSTIARFLYEDGFSSLHPALDPASRGRNELGTPYGVPPKRAARKREQIANLVAAVVTVHAIRNGGKVHTNSSSNRKIVDMCGGCGHVGLVLASLFRHYQVVVVDSRAFALDVVKRRAREAGLNNVDTMQCNIEDLQDLNFDIAVALHACGGASDTVLAKAAERKASVVIASCCTGGIVSSRGSVTGSASGSEVIDPASKNGSFIDWASPRSLVFRKALRSGEYSRLARAADFGEKLNDKDDWRRVAKSLLEQDRALWMEEAGYDTRILKMRPLTCSPKNDVLIAWPRTTEQTGFEVENSVRWDADNESNQFITNVRDGSVLRGFGDSEVSSIEKVLNDEVCAETSSGQYTFPKGTGKRMRKVIHAVADSMGLWHESDGKGNNRRVTVRRTEYWPLFYERFIGVGGLAVEDLCRKLVPQIPEHCARRRVLLRGNPHHVTIIRPPEMGKVPYHMRSNPSQVLKIVFARLSGSIVRIHGIGKVSQTLGSSETPHLHPEEGVSSLGDRGKTSCNDAYFVVLDWPEANAFRRDIGLEEIDFHITLGFTVKDIHNIPKNRSTIVLEHQKELQLW